MTASTVTVTLQAQRLQTLIGEFQQGQGMYVKVGILGDYAGRTPDQQGTKRIEHPWTKATRKFFGQTGPEPTNPELGAIHEFGSQIHNVPERSFLRYPLFKFLGSELADVDFISLIMQRGVFGAMDAIGNVALKIVLVAFDTGGYGTWQEWSPKYLALRMKIGASTFLAPGRLLVLTGQMVRSITYAVVRRGSPNSPIYAVE